MTDNETTILFAVRHGEAEWNLIGKQQGHRDSPLTASGIEQAHALADGLSGSDIEAIYSSDLGRALQTAEIIAARLALPISVDHRLRERHLGAMQGMTKAEFSERFPKESTAFDSGDSEYVLPGGESARQRFDRSIACCIELAARHPGGRILLVAHGGTLRSLFHHTLSIPLADPRRFSLFNAAINTFSVQGGAWRLDTWGDTCHLRGTATLDDN
jgi:2,3-bisphosphoglycerate-dependent phosphoglycerate mutase